MLCSLQGLCKVLGLTLMRYQDAQSRRLVLNLIRTMSTKFPQLVSKSIISIILDTVGCWRSTTATKSLSKPCLAALAWSVASSSGETVKDDAKKIVEVQSVLTGVIFTSGSRTVKEKASKLLESFWMMEGVVEYVVEAVISSDHSVYLTILGSQVNTLI